MFPAEAVPRYEDCPVQLALYQLELSHQRGLRQLVYFVSLTLYKLYQTKKI